MTTLKIAGLNVENFPGGLTKILFVPPLPLPIITPVASVVAIIIGGGKLSIDKKMTSTPIEPNSTQWDLTGLSGDCIWPTLKFGQSLTSNEIFAMATAEHSESHVLHPNDEHNQKLRDNVHPENWPTKPSTEVYDMVSIGAGTAGLVSSGGAAMLGARSALIERHLMGGDCLVTGCVPSKTLIMSAHVAHAARKASEFGVNVDNVSVDFGAVMELSLIHI